MALLDLNVEASEPDSPPSGYLRFFQDAAFKSKNSAGTVVEYLTSTTPGVFQPLNANLTSISGLTTAADTMLYFTGVATAALTTITAAGRAILDDADAAAQRTTLGVGTGDSPTFTGLNLSTLNFSGATSGVVTVTPASIAGTWTFTLPDSDGDSGQVLTTDGSGVTSWTSNAGGGGDVTGPASSTDNAAVRFDSTTGKLLQNSTFIIGDSTQPASVGTTPGTAASQFISTTPMIGGDTTIATTGTGGAGAAVIFTTGVGGIAGSAATASTGGNGGALTFNTGNGGLAAVDGTGTNTGGIGGQVASVAGTGGAATGVTSGTNTGGVGGSFTWTAGIGGVANSGSGSNIGGAGGGLTFNAGTGGIGSSTGGNGGAMNFNGGLGGDSGTDGAGGDIIFNTAATITRTEVFRLSSVTQGGLFTCPAAAVKGLVVRGAASQTANLQEWQNSAPTHYMAFSADGNVGINSTPSATAKLIVKSTTNTTTALSIQSDSADTTFANYYPALEMRNDNATNNNWVVASFTDAIGGTLCAGFACRIINHSNNYGDLGFFTHAADGPNQRIYITSAGLVGIGINNTAPTAQLHVSQDVKTTGSPTALLIAGAAHTTLTASTEATDINFNLARTVQFATGALTTQRAVRIQAPTYGFVGASTITNAATLAVSAAPVAGTNATITNSYAVLVEAGATNLQGSLQCDSIVNDTGLAAGTYTPTRSAEANMDGNVTMTEAQYMRVGNTVTVSGRFTADPTLPATATSFEMTLPVASNFGAVEDAAGIAFCGAIAGQGAEVSGSVANDTAVVSWISSDTTSQSWSYTFTYAIL